MILTFGSPPHRRYLIRPAGNSKSLDPLLPLPVALQNPQIIHQRRLKPVMGHQIKRICRASWYWISSCIAAAPRPPARSSPAAWTISSEPKKIRIKLGIAHSIVSCTSDAATVRDLSQLRKLLLIIAAIRLIQLMPLDQLNLDLILIILIRHRDLPRLSAAEYPLACPA